MVSLGVNTFKKIKAKNTGGSGFCKSGSGSAKKNGSGTQVDGTDQVEDRDLLQHVEDIGEVSARLLRRCANQAQVIQVPEPTIITSYRTAYQCCGAGPFLTGSGSGFFFWPAPAPAPALVKK